MGMGMNREWNLRNARLDLLALLWLCVSLSVAPQVCEGRDPHVAFGTRGAVVANDPLAVNAGMRCSKRAAMPLMRRWQWARP